jgi:hypothetical protein
MTGCGGFALLLLALAGVAEGEIYLSVSKSNAGWIFDERHIGTLDYNDELRFHVDVDQDVGKPSHAVGWKVTDEWFRKGLPHSECLEYKPGTTRYRYLPVGRSAVWQPPMVNGVDQWTPYPDPAGGGFPLDPAKGGFHLNMAIGNGAGEVKDLRIDFEFVVKCDCSIVRNIATFTAVSGEEMKSDPLELDIHGVHEKDQPHLHERLAWDNTPPRACGDPHFTTWSGDKFDFHGVCDLVLISNPAFGNGLGMDLHIRTEKTRMWSFISSAVLRIGQDILEVMGGADENRFWINKIRGDEEVPAQISGYPIQFEQLSPNARSFSILLGESTKIEIKTWNSYVSVVVFGASTADFAGALGLMGSFPSGSKKNRDNSTVFEDVNLFGQEWQVLPTEDKLFHDLHGPQSPQRCEIPSSVELRRRLGESLISKEDAERACARVDPADFDLCVFDVMATNDKNVAGAY